MFLEETTLVISHTTSQANSYFKSESYELWLSGCVNHIELTGTSFRVNMHRLVLSLILDPINVLLANSNWQCFQLLMLNYFILDHV